MGPRPQCAASTPNTCAREQAWEGRRYCSVLPCCSCSAMPGKLHCIRCCTAPSAGPDPTARTTTVYPSPNLHQGRDGNAGSAYLQRSPLSPTSGAAPTPLPVLEVLHAAQAAEAAVDHDGHPGAQRLALLHAAGVGGGGVRHTAETSVPPVLCPPPPSVLGTHLWDVSSTERPSLTRLRMQSHRKRRARGSIPVVGSSCSHSVSPPSSPAPWPPSPPPTAPLTRKMMGGLPSRAMAVDSLRLLPPLYVPARRSACGPKPSLAMPH